MTLEGIIMAVALWCDNPSMLTRPFINEVNVCREQLIICIESADPKSKDSEDKIKKCFKDQKLK